MFHLPHTSSPAIDTIQLSIHRAAIASSKDRKLMECSFDHLRLYQLVELLNMVHICQPVYTILSFSSWWFSTIALTILHTWGAWTVQPHDDIIKRVLRLCGRDTRLLSEKLRQEFFSRWTLEAPGSGSVDCSPDEKGMLWVVQDDDSLDTVRLSGYSVASNTHIVASQVVITTPVPDSRSQTTTSQSHALVSGLPSGHHIHFDFGLHALRSRISSSNSHDTPLNSMRGMYIGLVSIFSFTFRCYHLT